MRLSIEHTTKYRFTEPVVHGLQRLRLKPKDTHGQEIVDWNMHLVGAEMEVEYDDQHHNRTTLVGFDQGTQEIIVTCHGEVETSDKAGIVGQHAGHMPLWCFLRPTPLTRAGLKVRALVANVDADREDTLTFLHALSEAIREAVKYEKGVTDPSTSAEQALALGMGVCQDQAHVFLSAGRLLDIPMRYVGGYLMMNDRIDQEAGHGWAEAHVGDLGWSASTCRTASARRALCPRRDRL
ncbi:MAG: transglutaminase family protein [Sphingomonadaceae bacterium]